MDGQRCAASCQALIVVGSSFKIRRMGPATHTKIASTAARTMLMLGSHGPQPEPEPDQGDRYEVPQTAPGSSLMARTALLKVYTARASGPKRRYALAGPVTGGEYGHRWMRTGCTNAWAYWRHGYIWCPKSTPRHATTEPTSQPEQTALGFSR